MAQTTPEDAVEKLASRYDGLVLEDEEVGLMPVGIEPHADIGAGAGSWMLVGRFLTDKLIKLEFMQQVMASVWRPVKGVQVSEIEPNLFSFVFFHKSDLQRVLEEGPWSFENNTLVCCQVEIGDLPSSVVLDTVDLWVQLYDLPLGYTSDSVLAQIGNFIGSFLKCDDRQVSVPWRAFYRIRVSIPIAKPLKRRMKLIKRDSSWTWVNFKYERLHTFCFFCGLMGHSHKICLRAREATILVEQHLYGPYLRAGLSRGPRAVGQRWLVPAGGVLGGRIEGDHYTKGVVGWGGSSEVESGVLAASKRRREGEDFEDDPPVPMSTLSWNCRGLGNPRTVREVVDLVSSKKPDFVFLMETKVNREHAERLRIKIEFEGLFYVDRTGLGGGLALLWKRNNTAQLLSYSKNHVDIMVRLYGRQPWRMTCFYGFPERSRCSESWNLLRSLSTRSSLPWVVVGDFNDLLFQHEKRGPIPHPEGLLRGFGEALEDCGLLNVPTMGYSFTWERGKGTEAWVEERLDRVVATGDWVDLQGAIQVSNILTRTSDHSALFLDVYESECRVGRGGRRFRFEMAWLLDKGCRGVVEAAWRDGRANDEFRKLDFELSRLEAQEDAYWKQRAKQHWLRGADANTSRWLLGSTKQGLVMGLTRWCGVSPGSLMLMTRWFIPLCTLNSKKVWTTLDGAQLEVVAAVLSGIWQARNSVVWELKLPLPRQTWNLAAHNLEAWRHLASRSGQVGQRSGQCFCLMRAGQAASESTPAIPLVMTSMGSTFAPITTMGSLGMIPIMSTPTPMPTTTMFPGGFMPFAYPGMMPPIMSHMPPPVTTPLTFVPRMVPVRPVNLERAMDQALPSNVYEANDAEQEAARRRKGKAIAKPSKSWDSAFKRLGDKEDGLRKSSKLRLDPEMGRTSAMERLGGSRPALSRRSRESETIHLDEEKTKSQPWASAYTRLSYDEDDLDKIGSVARKLRTLEEKVEEKAGAKKHTLAKSPFSARVHAHKLRRKIKVDVEKFTRKEDPNIHLDTFHNAAQMAGCIDAEECLLFFSSLRGRPVEWFNSLPHGKVGSFEKLAEIFRRKYQDNCIKRKKFTYLYTVGQKETLTQFLTRWRDEVNKVEEMDDKTAMSLLMNAFRSGDLYTEFCRRPPSSYQKAYNTTWEYAEAEVLNKSKRELEEGYTRVKTDKPKKDDQIGGSNPRATHENNPNGPGRRNGVPTTSQILTTRQIAET
ncbi:unnamed protein product [Cuscuta campestris]|uniref:CCHC-type domain-containing protein n=1 Tax=Cuscuta campestris TaxID=132261 RepID=A0A484KHK2_9ASTE|nr:unnamed protein product [Cuscuta campestris]